MKQSLEIIDTLKKQLRAHGVTYADIATRLNMSEANIKRLFATRRFSVQRLEEVAECIDLDLMDLFDLHREHQQQITQLTEEQEQELVSNKELLMVAVSVRNGLNFAEITDLYNLDESRCIQYLAKLDRLKIIELLPNNRIKLKIDDHFRWLTNGPIERFFEQHIQSQFLTSRFNKEFEQRDFVFGLLSDSSLQFMRQKLDLLSHEFNQLHRQDLSLPFSQKKHAGLLLAIRPWSAELI